MLANPVLIPAYADPLQWCMALVASGAEVVAVALLLRRMGLTDRRFAGPLVVINLYTWVLFLVAVHLLEVHAGMWGVPVIFGLECVVVVAESFLIYLACRGRFFSSWTDWRPVTLLNAARLSLLGNIVSVAVGLLSASAIVSTLG